MQTLDERRRGRREDDPSDLGRGCSRKGASRPLRRPSSPNPPSHAATLRRAGAGAAEPRPAQGAAGGAAIEPQQRQIGADALDVGLRHSGRRLARCLSSINSALAYRTQAYHIANRQLNHWTASRMWLELGVPRSKGSRMLRDLDWKLRLGFLVHDVSRLRAQRRRPGSLKPLGVTRSQWWGAGLPVAPRRHGAGLARRRARPRQGRARGLVDRLEAAGARPIGGAIPSTAASSAFTSPSSGKTKPDQGDAGRQRRRRDADHRRIDDADLQATVRALRQMKANLLGLLGNEQPEMDSDAESRGGGKSLRHLDGGRRCGD